MTTAFPRSLGLGAGRPAGRGVGGVAGRLGIGDIGRRPTPAGRAPAPTACGERGSGDPPATACGLVGWGLVGCGPIARGGAIGRTWRGARVGSALAGLAALAAAAVAAAGEGGAGVATAPRTGVAGATGAIGRTEPPARWVTVVVRSGAAGAAAAAGGAGRAGAAAST